MQSNTREKYDTTTSIDHVTVLTCGKFALFSLIFTQLASPLLGNHFIAYQLNICRNYLSKIINVRNSYMYRVFIVFSSFLKI